MKTLPKFYIGQTVTAIESHIQGLTKGSEYIVTGVFERCHGYNITVGIKPFMEICYQICHVCGNHFNTAENGEFMFHEVRFDALIESFKSVTFDKIKESEPISVN